MERRVLDLVVTKATELRPGYKELRLANPAGSLPHMEPGQFVQVRIDETPTAFLRRPISINNVCDDELWLLVHAVGDGTRWLTNRSTGDMVNMLCPLGNGFNIEISGQHPLLVGGGVGTAPLLYLGRMMAVQGIRPTFLLGGRCATDLVQLDEFGHYGDVLLTTEDGSDGQRGFVTQHTVWQEETFTGICTCGPKPMMKAVAQLAADKGIPCQASLENMMACGLGACLCCVEDTVDGNICVCTEGPVFDTKRLKW